GGARSRYASNGSDATTPSSAASGAAPAGGSPASPTEPGATPGTGTAPGAPADSGASTSPGSAPGTAPAGPAATAATTAARSGRSNGNGNGNGATAASPSPAGAAAGGKGQSPSAPGGGNAAPAPGVPTPGPSPTPGAGPGDQTGVTNAEVLIGMHMPQSGPFGAVVGKAWEGAEAEFRAVNDAGGINGRKIRLIVDDDQYSAQGAEAAVRDLIENKKVFAVSCQFGVDQCTVGVNYANSRGVPYLHGGMAEAFLATKPWAFPVIASYPYGAVRLFDYLFTKRGYTPARKIAAFYLNSQNLDEMVAQADQKLAAFHAQFAVKY